MKGRVSLGKLINGPRLSQSLFLDYVFSGGGCHSDNSHVPACNKSLFLDYVFQGAGVTQTTHMSPLVISIS